MGTYSNKDLVDDAKLLQRCNVDEISHPNSEEGFEWLPCQKKFRFHSADEISLDSIFSALLAAVEPTEEEILHYKFDVPPRELLTDKAAILFNEQLYISKLKDSNCKLIENPVLFLENELEEVGEFKLKVEESYDGFVVFCKSSMRKGKNDSECGHWVRGKYDDHLNLICEKRSEFDYIDNVRIDKILDAHILDDKLIAKREIKINRDVQLFKAVINMKGRSDAFLFDGGILLLMRYLIVNNFRGDFHYFSMSIAGKIMRCVMNIAEERKRVKIFHRCFTNIIRVVNTQYFNNYPTEVSEAYYSPNGKIVLHFWHDFSYIIHETKGYTEPTELILPKMELMWRSNNELLKQYQLHKTLNYEIAMQYFNEHPELTDFIYDFMLKIIEYKPRNVLDFAVRYFQKFKKPR